MWVVEEVAAKLEAVAAKLAADPHYTRRFSGLTEREGHENEGQEGPGQLPASEKYATVRGDDEGAYCPFLLPSWLEFRSPAGWNDGVLLCIMVLFLFCGGS